MGESEEDQSSIPFILIVVLVAGMLFVMVTLTIQFLPVGGSSHPPQVLIWRENTPSIYPDDRIHIKYMGGIDDGFVGDFKVTVNGLASGNYPKPEAYDDVTTIESPKGSITCINVSAIDKAVQTYRPIGYNCT